MNIELITIGDEILLGHTLDINSHWIAQRLSDNGFRLRWHMTIGDNASDMRHVLRRALGRADVVILTGGLGPTEDDITRQVIARYFDDELIPRIDLEKTIRGRFSARGLSPPPGYEILAEFPSRAEPIPNAHGSAPGIHYCVDNSDLFALPGVPRELKGMFDNYVLPAIEAKRRDVFDFVLLKTTGIGESHLAEIIGDTGLLGDVSIAYLPSIGRGVSIRLSSSGNDREAVAAGMKNAAKHVRGLIDDYIFGTESDTLEAVILDIMRSRSLRLSLAESCTGGMICDRLIGVSGSSDVIDRGYVTYSNESKSELLSVDPSIIEQYGAVSHQVAAAMAEGARLKAGVDIAVSVTGIAGPTGGTAEKPVGLIYIGLADAERTDVQEYRFTGDRNSNRTRSAHAALTMLWRYLKQMKSGRKH